MKTHLVKGELQWRQHRNPHGPPASSIAQSFVVALFSDNELGIGVFYNPVEHVFMREVVAPDQDPDWWVADVPK